MSLRAFWDERGRGLSPVEMVCSSLSLAVPSSVVRHQASAATATESGGFCSRNAPPKADYDDENDRSQQDRRM